MEDARSGEPAIARHERRSPTQGEARAQPALPSPLPSQLHGSTAFRRLLSVLFRRFSPFCFGVFTVAVACYISRGHAEHAPVPLRSRTHTTHCCTTQKRARNLHRLISSVHALCPPCVAWKSQALRKTPRGLRADPQIQTPKPQNKGSNARVGSKK